MKLTNKKEIKKVVSFVTILVIATLVLLALNSRGANSSEDGFRGIFPQQSSIPATYASSTSFSLTWGLNGGTRIVATSTRNVATSLIPTTYGRTGLSLQAINCNAGGHVWVNFNDVGAATSTSLLVAASTTVVLGDTVPMVYGSINATASYGNCTLNVIEYRSIN